MRVSEAKPIDLEGRLSLIETMIAEGRQTTVSWGWSFVLWGLAYYAAIAWATLGHSNIAWPVVMIGTSILTAVVSSRMNRQLPETTMSRAIGAIWIAVGISLFVFCLSTALSGHAEQHAFLAVIEAMLGAANAASGLLLKWKVQFAAGVVWWMAAVASCFGTIGQSSAAFLTAIFLCQIVFGGYMMWSEARERRLVGRMGRGSMPVDDGEANHA